MTEYRCYCLKYLYNIRIVQAKPFFKVCYVNTFGFSISSQNYDLVKYPILRCRYTYVYCLYV